MYPVGDGTFILRAEYRTDGTTGTVNEAPVNNFELIGQNSTKDIKTHYRIVNLGEALIAYVVTAYNDLQKEPIASKATKYAALIDLIEDRAGNLGVNQADAVGLFKALVIGHTHTPQPAYVLRHTKTYSSRATSKASFLNIPYGLYVADGAGSVSSAMNAELEAQGTPIDAGTLFNLSDIDKPTPKAGYSWGWVKQPPGVQSSPGRSKQIIQEWHLDQWLLLTYSPV